MVDGNCADPGGESTVTPESGEAVPGGDEGVEHDLFGDARIVGQSQRERVDLLAVRPEQSLERLPAPGSRPVDEIAFRERISLRAAYGVLLPADQ